MLFAYQYHKILFTSKETYAISFSSGVSHLTVSGVPRTKKQTTVPTMVRLPRNSDIVLQAAIDDPFPTTYLAMPYKIRLQTIEKNPCEDCQNSERLACSARRYQAPVINRKPGVTLLSKTPCKPRRTISWVKLLQALMQSKHTDHPNM